MKMYLVADEKVNTIEELISLYSTYAQINFTTEEFLQESMTDDTSVFEITGIKHVKTRKVEETIVITEKVNKWVLE